MDKVAIVSPRRRRVRCSNCLAILVEPPESPPIFQCGVCSTLLRAKGTPPDFQGELRQIPVIENGHGILEAKSVSGSEPSRSQGQDQLDDHEINEHMSMDASIRHQEQILIPERNESVSVLENEIEQELQLQGDVGNGSTLAGNLDTTSDYACQKSTAIGEEGLAMEMQKPSDYVSKESTSASKSNESEEAELLMDHMNIHGISSNGDDKVLLQLPLEDAQNCSKSSASKEENVLAGKCEGVEGKNHKECDTLADGKDQTFESEIIRESEYDLSFKYISSSTLELDDQLIHRKRTHRLTKLSSEASVLESEVPIKPLFTERLPSSSDENSNESESYSSISESASHDGSDSDFDFPAPSAQNMLLPKLTDSFLQQKMPSPCDVPATPHQLEWQDVHYDNKESSFQDSNGAIVSSVGVASHVLTVVKQGDQVDIAEIEPHIQEEILMKRETLLRGHDDTTGNVSGSQKENGYSGLGCLANTVGFVASEGGDKNVVLGDTAGTEEDSNDYQGSLPYQFNERKDSWDEVSESLDVLSSGAGPLLKLKAHHTLQEGNLNTSMLSSGTEPSLPGSSNEETCLAVRENIQLIKSEANVMLQDSVVSSSSDYAANASASHSKIASQMISKQKIWEKSSDHSHLQHDMRMPEANNQSKRAVPNSDLATKTDVENFYLARNRKLEYAGVHPSVVTEQNDLSSHSSVNKYKRNHLSEKTQVHNGEGDVSMFDSGLHHRRNYLSEATQVHDMEGALRSKHTFQVQQNIHNEGLHMSREARIMEGSSKTHQRLVPAASGLSNGQGPLLQKQNCQADLHMMEQTINHSGPVKDVRSFSPASSQPFGFPNYSNGSNLFTRGVPSANMAYSYQDPSHPLILPVAMQGHTCSHFGCHSVAPVCMACVHHCQHSHLPQPMPPCVLCFSQPFSMAHQQGHAELWNYHQAHQVQAPDQGVSVVHCSPTCFSSQTVHMHDTAMAAKPLVSSARELKRYPPLPRGSTAPYVLCKRCDEVLQVPAHLPPSDGAAQKLRCGACRKVSQFSVPKGIQETCNVGLQSSAVESTNEVSTSTLPLGHYTDKHSRQLPVSNVIQSTESSYQQGLGSELYAKYQQGVINLQHQTGGGVVPAGINRRLNPTTEDEIIFKSQSRQGEADTEITAAVTDHSSQGEFFFRCLSRQCEFDSSRSWFKASSSAIGAINCGNEGLIVGNVLPLQPSVDEKEEGLDFGAPRMSDGESLDQISPESRKRSPENKQYFQLVEQNMHRKGSLGEGEACQTTGNMQHQVFELNQNSTTQEKRSSTSLIALLNQESTKFAINMEERVSFEESRSALWSPATNSPLNEDHTNQSSNRDEDIDQPSNLTAQYFVRKGPRYIADMLRRSLKDFRKGIQ